MSWQQVGAVACDVAERLEPRALKVTVYQVEQEPLVLRVPIKRVEHEPLNLKIRVERAVR